MQTTEKKDIIYDLIKDGTEANVVYFRSGPNHPWRKMRFFLTKEEEKEQKKQSRKSFDPDNVERNLRWWNNYIGTYIHLNTLQN